MSDVFLLPDPGEGLTEADIVSWKVAAGDAVTVNQILVEIETAKSLVELPSPHAGTIGALLVDEGETVAVGTPIVRFGPVGGEDPAPGHHLGRGGIRRRGRSRRAVRGILGRHTRGLRGSRLVVPAPPAQGGGRRCSRTVRARPVRESGDPVARPLPRPRPPSRRPMTSLPPRGVRHRPGATAGRWRSRPCGSSRRSTASTWRP